MRKLLLLFLLLQFHLLHSTVSNAQPVIIGSDTVCAGYMYSYKVIMPGAVTFNWTLPTGWYFLNGQGTDSVRVNCNVSATQVCVTGHDALGNPIDSVCLAVHWGGGSGWYVSATQYWYPPCYCQSYWTVQVYPQNPSCPGGCGSGVPNPNVYFAVFDNFNPTLASYVGPVATASIGGNMAWTYYVYVIDTTFGLSNMILVSGGGCGPVNNSFSVPGDPPCVYQIGLTQNPSPICVGDTFVMYASQWPWMWYLWSSNWSTSSPNITLIGPTNLDSVVAVLTGPGPAFIDFYGYDGCGTYWGSAPVNYSTCAPPVPAFYANPLAICVGSCVQFYSTTQDATSFQWSFPGGNPSTSTSQYPYVCYSASGQYSATLTAFNSYGSQTLTQTNYITVNPVPTLSVSPQSAICAGQSTTLTVSGASTYIWSPAATLTPSTGPNVSAHPLVTTTYTVTGTQNGCTASAQVTVTVSPTPQLTVSPTQFICYGQSVTLTVSGANSYLWSPAMYLSNPNSAIVTATPPSSGVFTVTGTTGNCTSTAQVMIYVDPLPNVTVTPDDTICNSQSITLTANGASTYSWNPSSTLSSSTGSSVTATPSSTTTYTVIGDLLGCTATAQITVTVNPSPAVFVSPDDTICNGQSIALAAGGANSYSWSPFTSLSSSTGPNVIANPSSTITYTVTGTDNYGCTAISQVTVTVNPPPAISASPSLSICFGQAAALMASGASTYAWSPFASLNSSTGSNVTATPSATTTYIVIGTDNNGCTATSQVTVTVNPLPVLSVSPDDTICTGQSAQLTSTGANTYTWSPSSTLSSSTGSSVTANPSSTTTYTVIGDLLGCTATAQVTVTVSPFPILSVSPDDTICNGQTVQLTSTGANTYLWSPSVSLSSSTGSSVTANPSLTTTYTVVGDLLGCTATAQVTVTVNPSPIVIISSLSTVICTGQNTLLNASGANSYSWSPSTSLSAATGNSVTANPASTTTYTVIGDMNGCTASAQVSITVNPLPAITVSSDVTICKGDSTLLIATGASTYIWSPAVALNSTSGDSVIASPLSTITYFVTATTANGCTATGSVTVTVNPTLTVPPLIQVIDTLFCNTGFISYQWYLNLVAIPGATNFYYVALQTGTYTVDVTDSNGCHGNASIYFLVTGLPQDNSSVTTSVYPNPFTTTATLLLKTKNYYSTMGIFIYDIQGRDVTASMIISISKTGIAHRENPEVTIHRNTLPPGMYFYSVTGDYHVIAAGKLVAE